ncbi:MAG: methyltransferase family protein [Candidatus Helarchaeota archaeon]
MYILFTIVIITEVILCGSLIFSIIFPKYRIWPPLKKNSWQFYFTWTLTIIPMLGIFILGILDWNNFLYYHFSRFIIGAVLIFGGTFFLVWGIRTLSIHTTLGHKGELLTNGPYKYSRNPQYIGDIAIFIGYFFVSNSFLVLIGILIGIICFILTPFTEEPWLRKLYGDIYNEYCQKVPRFFKLFFIKI